MIDDLLASARAATASAPSVGDERYERYCRAFGACLSRRWPALVEANHQDIARAEERGLSTTLLDRMRLTDTHLGGLVQLSDEVRAALPAVAACDPGVPLAGWGVRRRVPKPLGVVLMVYEARPTVTVEGALLPVVLGNAVVLRGGTELIRTNRALAEAARMALRVAGLPADLVIALEDPDRTQLRAMLARPDAIDVLIPRGSRSLIEYCRTATSIPVIASGGGVNHIYVHRSADLTRAAEVALDSKLPEPTACNTAELVLVDAEVAENFVSEVLAVAERDQTPVTVRVAAAIARRETGRGPWRLERLREHDLGREFLDATIGVLPVAGLDEALAHIRRHGSGHTEGVIASDDAVVEAFTRSVDAAAIVVNGSLRLHDGPTLGLGPELSISTGRLHARGPVSLNALVTYSWVVEADGALRSAVEAGPHPANRT